MLESIKKTYEEYADLYIKENWRKENKNNLFLNYIKNEAYP